jgi:hypothetical protein
MQSVESANLYDISAFEVACPAVTDSFTVNLSDNKASFSAGELDLTKTEVKNMLESFYNIFSYVSISDIAPDDNPSLQSPVLSAKYTKNSGETVNIDLVPTGNDDECYVFYCGEYTGTKTMLNFMTGQNSMESMYEILKQYASAG